MAFKHVTITGIHFNELPKLTKEERYDLLKGMRNGDLEAKETFIKGNLRLVLNVVQRFAGSDIEADDLFQVGCIGLTQAVNRFDPSFGVEFSTYAVPMIMGQIQRYLRESNYIHVPRSMKQRFFEICARKADMEEESDREVSYGEAAQSLGYPESESSLLCLAFLPPRCFDDPVKLKNAKMAEEREVTLLDMLPDRKTDENRAVEYLDLFLALEKLSPTQCKIINFRYFEGLTQREVAKLLDYSQAQISRLERAALRKLRKELV